MKVVSRSCILGAALMILASAAQADVKYTMTQRMPDYQSEKKDTLVPYGRTTTYTKAGAQRTESESDTGAYKMKTVSYTVCADKQTVRLDSDLKIYAITPLNNNSSSNTSTQDTAKPAQKSNAKPATGKITMTVTVKNLGIETIANRKARHYMITSNMVTLGCAGDSNINSKQEIWVADYTLPVFDCGNNGYDWKSAYTNNKPDCIPTFDMKGDVAAYNEAYKGLIVKQRIFDDKGKVIMESELTELSEAKLDNAPFSIPAGYKQVTEKEFDELRSKAMMKAMMQDSQNPGTKSKPTNNDDDSDDASTVEDVSEDNTPEDNDSAAKAEAERILKEQAKQKARKKLKFPF
jgi:hypothetical protein